MYFETMTDIDWEQVEYCAKCHNKLVNSYGNKRYFALLGRVAQYQEICKNCSKEFSEVIKCHCQ